MIEIHYKYSIIIYNYIQLFVDLNDLSFIKNEIRSYD